ncbi:MAG: squalene/phytoene synthase family protein [Thermoanaerobaculia bacterium]|jgi:farnesyl-diphosphate farnesyltransferase
MSSETDKASVATEQSRTSRQRQNESELLQDLLVKTSRTFALAIPLLPDPTLREVTIAYLLFRIADTFEDASVLWEKPQQIRALEAFGDLLRDPSVERAREQSRQWQAKPSSEHPGYLELLDRTPDVIAAFLELTPGAQRVVAHHTIRTAEGMASVVERTGSDGVLRLDSIPELQDYCYIVAGIVGEMLTDLFLLERPSLEPIADYLRQRSVAFGEGLQLVNILKDSADDSVEGRNYLPYDIEREEVFDLARQDLEAATDYTLAIQQAGGPDGLVLFTGLPVALAWATLDKVEKDGPGAKIGRVEVLAIHSRLKGAVAAGRPAIRVPSSRRTA